MLNHLDYFSTNGLSFWAFSGEGHRVSCLEGVPLATSVLKVAQRKGAGDLLVSLPPTLSHSAYLQPPSPGPQQGAHFQVFPGPGREVTEHVAGGRG